MNPERTLTGPVRYSALKLMGRSAAHYRAQFDVSRPDTAAMKLGRLVHHLVLGSDEDWVVFEGEARRGKAWTDFLDAHGGETERIVKDSEMAQAQAMADAVRRHPEAPALLDGESEVEIGWTVAGRACGGRVDKLGQSRFGPFLTELKTTGDARPGLFGWHCRRMQYHQQLAWYMDGAEASGRPRPERAYIVAVETAYPYLVSCYESTPRALEVGRRTVRLWWEQLMACEAAGTWPGYFEGVYPLDLAEDEELVFPDEEVTA